MKRKNSVGYFSAYYRGLESLLNMWPKVREKVPDAALNIAYGWESWVAAKGKDEFYVRMNKKFAELKSQGVTVHGRLTHEQLAKLMTETQVWAYPTQFAEIFCITAIKANAAHMRIVVTDVAALNETMGPIANVIESERIYIDEYAQEEFVEAVVAALKKPLTRAEQELQNKFVQQYRWQKIAREWHDTIISRT